jgi:hypothetical protein
MSISNTPQTNENTDNSDNQPYVHKLIPPFSENASYLSCLCCHTDLQDRSTGITRGVIRQAPFYLAGRHIISDFTAFDNSTKSHQEHRF